MSFVNKWGKEKLPEDGDAMMKRYSIRLSFRQKRIACKLGDGNLGAGIRGLINRNATVNNDELYNNSLDLDTSVSLD